MKRVLTKWNNSAGFTLSEVLIAVAILVMISAGLMPAAMNAYRNAVDAANAQALLSASVDALRNELATAWDVRQGERDEEITYMSVDTGSRTKMYLNDKVIALQEYEDFTGATFFDESKTVAQPEERPLVSQAMKKTTQDPAKDMFVVYESVIPQDETIVIKGLHVERGAVTLAAMPGDLIIKPLGGEKE